MLLDFSKYKYLVSTPLLVSFFLFSSPPSASTVNFSLPFFLFLFFLEYFPWVFSFSLLLIPLFSLIFLLVTFYGLFLSFLLSLF